MEGGGEGMTGTPGTARMAATATASAEPDVSSATDSLAQPLLPPRAQTLVLVPLVEKLKQEVRVTFCNFCLYIDEYSV